MVPTSNQARNTADGEGSSSTKPTSFETIIIPNQNSFDVPQEFVQNWKHEIALDKYASIKDPADNFFEIDPSTILTEFAIHAGIIISVHCGFTEPQKVILDYQPQFGQYNMRIIDAEGKDVPYFGFHAPINHHALKMADPNYKVNPQFISMVKAPGTTCIPIGFAMMHMGIGNADQDQEEFSHPYEWLANVSEAIAGGISVLHFPAWVAKAAKLKAGSVIEVMNDETLEVVECTIKKSKRKPPEYSIGGAWYKFVVNLNLSVKDVLVFGMEDPPQLLHVVALRNYHQSD